KSLCPQRSDFRWEIRLGFFADESLKRALPVYEERAAVVLPQTLDAIRLTRQRVKLRRSRVPSPQTISHTGPQIPLAVLVQTEPSEAKLAVFAVALDVVFANHAQLAAGDRGPACPHASFTILEDLEDEQSIQLGVLSEPAVSPT